jgi:chromate reductase
VKGESGVSSRPLRILGIPGSLRRGSYNRALLCAAREVAPDGVQIELFELHDIPPYNEDVRQQGVPEPVARLNAAIAAADAVLISTPEYNWSIPGVLKNAIDWVSRPPASTPLRRKPVAVIGASGGSSGTIRAQLALRQVLFSLECYVLPKPDLWVRNAGQLFDQEGRLIDQETRQRLHDLVVALVDWTERLRD